MLKSILYAYTNRSSVCAIFLASCLCSKQSLQESDVDETQEQLTEVSGLYYDKLIF